MPFRARMKRAFTRSNSSSNSSNDSNSVNMLDHRKDPSVYAPGEVMPRPKYRAPVDKKHKEMLDTFKFGNWRKKSDSSLYSPFGSKMPSRNNSVNEPKQTLARGPSIDRVVENASDEEDLANVGKSQVRHISNADQSPYMPSTKLGEPKDAGLILASSTRPREQNKQTPAGNEAKNKPRANNEIG